MGTLVDRIAAPLRWALMMFGRSQHYALNDNSATVQLVVYVRGVRADDLFANAQQQDIAAVINAAAFRAAFAPRATPQRYDRLRISGRSWSVEEWRGSPNDDEPVFYKLLLRGGSQ
jgi:hypothetical protein